MERPAAALGVRRRRLPAVPPRARRVQGPLERRRGVTPRGRAAAPGRNAPRGRVVSDFDERIVRPISHWSPYDRVRAVNAVP
eukprot:30443-Pelagococcus_subviridis.AAC.6